MITPTSKYAHISNYLTISSYSLDAFLFHKLKENKNFEIKLYNSKELTNCISRNIRGGFCTVISHHESFYDVCSAFETISQESQEKLNKRIQDLFYFDINSNYSLAMIMSLPEGFFEQINKKQIISLVAQLKENKIDFEKSKVGYFLEVTLMKTSKRMQEQTDMYPFALENKSVFLKNASDYTQNKIPSHAKNTVYKRLMGHHLEKRRMLISAHLLQYYITRENYRKDGLEGLQIKTVHKAYKFRQSHFLKTYIEQNIERCKDTDNKTKSNMYKLINNSIFGKMLTNVMNYNLIVNLVTNKRSFL